MHSNCEHAAGSLPDIPSHSFFITVQLHLSHLFPHCSPLSSSPITLTVNPPTVVHVHEFVHLLSGKVFVPSCFQIRLWKFVIKVHEVVLFLVMAGATVALTHVIDK